MVGTWLVGKPHYYYGVELNIAKLRPFSIRSGPPLRDRGVEEEGLQTKPLFNNGKFRGVWRGFKYC